MALERGCSQPEISVAVSEGSAPHSYELTSSRVSSTGLLIGHYKRAGDIAIGDTALDSPSDAERARRERMKRKG
jgi:hypothetical protein